MLPTKNKNYKLYENWKKRNTDPNPYLKYNTNINLTISVFENY